MQVIITPRASKQFGRLPRIEQAKIKKKLTVLENDPYAGKKLSGELSETRSLRAWPYRVLYYIDQEKNTLFVISVLHRQGAYK